MELAEAQKIMETSANTSTPMPSYQSHKRVWALQIKEVLDPGDGRRIIVPAESGYAPFAVHPIYVTKHNPQPGGYFVTYGDGYQSFSPAKPFKEGYTRVMEREADLEQDLAGIGWAIKQMHNGRKVLRAGWNGKNMYLALQVPDAHSKMTEPYVYMYTAKGGLIPWLCSQADLLATDWEVTD